MAMLKVDPEVPPTNNPSSLINLLDINKDSVSWHLYHLSTWFLEKTFGIKSYPKPSVLNGSLLSFKD